MDAATWKRLKGVIADAMTRPPGERQAFVRDRCTDASLVREALSLLAYGEANPHFVARVTAEPDESGDPDDLPIGTRIGQYEVVGRLGRGGMGQVFLAYDHELNRSVALKCLLSGGNEEVDQSRIRFEAQAAAAITHPHIAAVYHLVDYGPRAFIVMEYVAGESLSALMRRARLRVDQAVTITRQLASALIAAHNSGVIHGDLKPANVHVTPNGSVKILDFGIAMVLRPITTAAADDATTARKSADILRHEPTPLMIGGTPPYMSPEQIIGSAVDQRSDIFSLGVMLFEMVTGHRPFVGADAAEIFRAQAAPAQRADAVERNVPRALADVIALALQVELPLRYQSVAEMDRALALVQPKPKHSARELIRAWVPRIAIVIVLTVAVLGTLGAIKTFGFNNNFGRTGPHARFGTESLATYLRWGMLGIGPKLLVLTITTVAVMGVGVLLRGLEMIEPIGRAMRPLYRQIRVATKTMGFDRPSVLAQALAGAGVVGVILLVWFFGDLISAFQASFNSAPIERLMPMRESARIRGYYQLTCSLLTVSLGVGLVRVMQLRRRLADHETWMPVAALVAVIVVTLLMTEVPYRSLNHRDFERVQYAGERCYIIGESGNELLILCTTVAPPRNRVVRRDDPQLRRLGITENVFRGLDPFSTP